MKNSSIRHKAAAAVLAASTLMVTAPAMAGDNVWTSFGPDATGSATVEWGTGDIAWMDSMDIIWRSSNGGGTWDQVGVTPDFGTICDFAPDPADSSRILIVNCNNAMWILNSDGSSSSMPYTDTNHRGQTIAASGSRIYSGGQGTGIRVSTDGGASWTDSSTGLPPEFSGYKSIYTMEASPVDANYAWASIWADGVYYSHDGGANWTKAAGLPLTSFNLAAHPTDKNILVAATASGIYKSTDGGVNWSASNTGVTGNSSDIAYASIDGNTLYMSTEEGDVYQSTDGGANWASVGSAIGSEYLRNVAANSSSGDVIVSGWEGSFRSADDGTSWDAVTGIKTLAVNDFAQSFSNSDKLYMANNSAGVYVSGDNGQSWTLERTGLSRSDVNTGFKVNDLDVNESHDVVLLGSEAMFTWREANTDWQGPVMGTGSFVYEAVTINPSVPANIVAAYWEPFGAERGLMATVDGGQNWTKPALFDDESVTAVAFAPSDGNVVYAGAQGGAMWKSEDGGLSWVEVLAGDGYGEVASIAIDPADANRVFAVFTHATVDARRSTDGGDTWESIASSEMSGLKDIAVSPHDSNELLAASNVYGVFRSVDGGENWSAINEGNLHDVVGARVVAFDKANSSRLIAGFDDLGLAELAIKPDLVLEGPASSDLDTVGEASELQFTVVADSTIVARDVALTLELDERLSVDSLNPECSLDTNIVSCNFGGGLGNDVMVGVGVTASEAGDYTISGSVSSRETDLNPADNAGTWTFTVTASSGGGSGGGDNSGGGSSSGGGGPLGFAMLGLLCMFGIRRRVIRP